MKKYIYATSLGLVVLAGTAVQSTFAATSATESRTLPPEFSVLTTTELETLESLTGSARDEYLTSKGITRPTASGELQDNPGHIELTEAERTALESMTETERQAFFASKWLTPPTGSGTMTPPTTGSGKLQNMRNTRIQNRIQSNSGTTITTTTTLDSQKQVTQLARAERIAQNKAKQLEQRKQKIQNRIVAGESLTRLEKKFADANNIDY